MKRVLVTGGAGFIGSNVVRLLTKRGYRVVVLDNLTTGYLENLEGIQGADFVKGDVTDADTLENVVKENGVEMIFHLAGTVGNLKSIEFPKVDAQVNVLGTLNVLEVARHSKVRKIVYSSSAAIFGELRYLPIDEMHPVEPDSPYGVTKLAGEKHCLCYSRLYDMSIVCLRYFNVYGRNQRYDPYGNVIPIWTHNALSGRPLTVYGEGNQSRDFINVEDVALANVMAGEKEKLSGAFNIGTGISITINDLAGVFKDIYSDSVQIVYQPPRKGEVMHSRADITKATTAFGFVPAVSIVDGLKSYTEWIRAEFYSR